jgi:hypothetical protein
LAAFAAALSTGLVFATGLADFFAGAALDAAAFAAGFFTGFTGFLEALVTRELP